MELLLLQCGQCNSMVQQIGQGNPSSDYMDFSQEMIKYMLLPELPELPESENELTKSLFPQQHGKIPGEKKTYLAIKRQWPLDAESFLIEADGSELPLKLSGVVDANHLLSSIRDGDINLHYVHP